MANNSDPVAESQARLEANHEEIKSLAKAVRKNMQMNILSRFLSQEELDSLIDKYNTHRKTSGRFGTRINALSQTPSDVEMEMLRAYYDELSTPIYELERRFGIKKGVFLYKIYKITKNYLYQNRDLVGL